MVWIVHLRRFVRASTSTSTSTLTSQHRLLLPIARSSRGSGASLFRKTWKGAGIVHGVLAATRLACESHYTFYAFLTIASLDIDFTMAAPMELPPDTTATGHAHTTSGTNGTNGTTDTVPTTNGAEESTATTTMPGLSADEMAQYDRQIRLWGAEAQQRIRSANILLISLRALGTEIAKNLTLAGVQSLTIIDDDVVVEEDLGAQFFVREEDIGKPVCCPTSVT